MPTVRILGVSVAAEPARTLTNRVLAWAAGKERAEPCRVVCATSAHGLVLAARERGFSDLLNRAALVVPDGMPLLWVGRLRGHGAMQRLRGTDLMRGVCAGSVGKGIRHYLYGGGPGVADRLARALEDRYPGIAIAACETPPFRPPSDAEVRAIAGRIDAAGAAVVWVGLSTPRQENVATRLAPLLDARVAVTVGAAFDFLAGTAHEAPRLIRNSGFEWLYRLASHPRRLGLRYLMNVPAFTAFAAAELFGLMRFPRAHR